MNLKRDMKSLVVGKYLMVDECNKEYTVSELADLLGVHINTIRYALKHGLLEGTKIGTQGPDNPEGRGLKWYFTEKDLGLYLYRMIRKERAIKR